MNVVTLEDLTTMCRLAEQLLERGQSALTAATSLDSFDSIRPILQERELIFNEFKEFLDLDLNAIHVHHEEEAMRQAALSVIEALQSVVQQNEELSRVILRLKQNTEMNLQRIDGSMAVIKKYYPMLSAQASQFDDKR